MRKKIEKRLKRKCNLYIYNKIVQIKLWVKLVGYNNNNDYEDDNNQIYIIYLFFYEKLSHSSPTIIII